MMSNKELLYELSLKFNTLKMYENTLEQMRKNGFHNNESFLKVKKEKNDIENEINELLNPKAEVTESVTKRPSAEEIEKDNKFVKELKTNTESNNLYDIRKNFFADIKPLGDGKDKISYRKAEIPEDKKPTFSDIQEKISNSQWISCSNFIIEFPKNEINIDEWRVSSFFYINKQSISCSSQRSNTCMGELNVAINDFAEKREDGTYNILAKIVNKLEASSRAHIIGNINANIINNEGKLLYTMCFKNCIFTGSDAEGFTYDSTDLRKVILKFSYDELIILDPNGN